MLYCLVYLCFQNEINLLGNYFNFSVPIGVKNVPQRYVQSLEIRFDYNYAFSAISYINVNLF